jgi:polyribonucleotide nucleotidyltransferase
VNSVESMQSFALGDVVTGVVQSVKPYGAFLDIGGTMGLLHISQITHERLTTVEQVLQVRHMRGPVVREGGGCLVSSGWCGRAELRTVVG